MGLCRKPFAEVRTPEPKHMNPNRHTDLGVWLLTLRPALSGAGMREKCPVPGSACRSCYCCEGDTSTKVFVYNGQSPRCLTRENASSLQRDTL